MPFSFVLSSLIFTKIINPKERFDNKPFSFIFFSQNLSIERGCAWILKSEFGLTRFYSRNCILLYLVFYSVPNRVSTKVSSFRKNLLLIYEGGTISALWRISYLICHISNDLWSISTLTQVYTLTQVWIKINKNITPLRKPITKFEFT